jgi:hypothetical protein
MLCTTFDPLCGQQDYVALMFKNMDFIGFVASSTPHNIFHLRLAAGLPLPRLGRYVQKTIPLPSGDFAPRQRSVGQGANHVPVTPCITRHSWFDSLALRHRVESDLDYAGQSDPWAHHSPSDPSMRPTPGTKATTTRPRSKSEMAQGTFPTSGQRLVFVHGLAQG